MPMGIIDVKKHDSSTNEIKSEELGNDYLHGKLSAEQQRDYEVFLLEQPEKVDDLIVNALLKNNLQYAQIKQPNRLFSWASLLPSGLTALACSLVFVVAVSFGVVDFNSASNSIRSPNVSYVELYRSTSSATSVHFSSNEDKHVLISPLNTNSRAKVSVRLESAYQRKVLDYEQLPNNNNEVVIELNKSMLKQGVYELTITDSHSNEVLVSQPLMVSID